MPLDPNLNPATHKFNVVGTRPVRPDGIDKVTGRAKFGADAVAPGMLIGKILRSPHAHAKIKSIDVSKAAKLPGVKAIVTRDDFKERATSSGTSWPATRCSMTAMPSPPSPPPARRSPARR